MASIGELTAKINLDTAGFTKGVNESQKTLTNLSRKFGDIGTQMTTKLTLPAAGLGAAILKSSGDFESSMNRVKALTSSTESEFEQLENVAKDLGESTMFSASEAASGMQFLAMAGFETNEIVEAMPGLLDLAASAQLDLGAAADITSNLMSQFGVEASDSTRIADVLSKTVNSSNQNMEQLAEAMNYIGPTANAMGMTIEETASVIALMADNGLQGSIGTRALGTSLTRLSKPTKAMIEKMDELNLEFFDSKGEFIGVAESTDMLKDRFKNLTTEQQQNALATLFGAEAIQEWNILTSNGGDVLRDFTKDLENSGGTAKKVADTQMEGLNAELKLLTSRLEGLAIAIADAGLIEFITNVVGKIAEFITKISELNPNILKIITVVVGLLAILGPVISILGVLITVVKGVAVAFAFLAANPIILIIAAIIALVAGIVLLIKNWDKVKEVIMNVVSSIVTFLKNNFESIKSFFFKPFTDAIDVLVKYFDNIKFAAQLIFTSVKNTFTNMKNNVIDTLTSIINKIKNFFTNAKNVGSALGTAIKDFINKNVIDKFNNFTIDVLGTKINFPDLPRFQDGGIIGGTSMRGDNVLARVNSGEMILNKQQQQNLFDMIKEGKGGGNNITINNTFEKGMPIEAISNQIIKQIKLGY